LRGAGEIAAAKGAGSGRFDCVSRAGEEGGCGAVNEKVDFAVSSSSSSESLKSPDCLVCGVEARALEETPSRTVVLGVEASVWAAEDCVCVWEMEVLGRVVDAVFAGVDVGADGMLRMPLPGVSVTPGMAVNPCVGVLDQALGGGEMPVAGCPEAAITAAHAQTTIVSIRSHVEPG